MYPGIRYFFFLSPPNGHEKYPKKCDMGKLEARLCWLLFDLLKPMLESDKGGFERADDDVVTEKRLTAQRIVVGVFIFVSFL